METEAQSRAGSFWVPSVAHLVLLTPLHLAGGACPCILEQRAQAPSIQRPWNRALGSVCSAQNKVPVGSSNSTPCPCNGAEPGRAWPSGSLYSVRVSAQHLAQLIPALPLHDPSRLELPWDRARTGALDGAMHSLSPSLALLALTPARSPQHCKPRPNHGTAQPVPAPCSCRGVPNPHPGLHLQQHSPTQHAPPALPLPQPRE